MSICNPLSGCVVLVPDFEKVNGYKVIMNFKCNFHIKTWLAFTINLDGFTLRTKINCGSKRSSLGADENNEPILIIRTPHLVNPSHDVGPIQ